MSVILEIEVPSELSDFRLPEGLQQRLQELLDQQDRGEALTDAQRKEAEGLVDVAQWLSLLGLRAKRLGHQHNGT